MVDDDALDSIFTYITNCERVRRSIIDSNDIRKMNAALDLIDYKTFPSKGKVSKDAIFMTGSAAVGWNVCLESHVDCDFGISMACILKPNHHCQNDDAVVVYFCFPRLGLAVPLRPGDVFLFNPREPHCLSSRCEKSDDLYCISFYLKSNVVGLHDNSIPLLPKEKKAVQAYHNHNQN